MRHKTIALSSMLAATLLATALAMPVPADAQRSRPDYARLQVGETLPGGYVITQRWGPGAFIAKRGNDIFFVRGDTISWLDRRYAIGPQIDRLDPRRRRFRRN